MAPISLFANRLPVRRVAGAWRPSPGGLVSALGPALQERGATWIGWDPAGEGVPPRVDGLEIDLRAVALSRGEVEGSYHGFANRTLWPLLHGLVEEPVFDPRWWAAYRAANERFCEADPGGGAVRWVHDYHLTLLPGLLRRRCSDGPISFFLHVPFPAPELFARLPWRTAVLEGMLGADVVSFHTEAYRDNFLRTCARVLDDVRVSSAGLELWDGRTVRVTANPISIDAGEVAAAAAARGAERRLGRLRQRFEGRRVLLGVDRLDYTKGIAERLRAIELLLELRPEHRRRVAFVQIAVPSRGEIREYDELRSTVERLVGRINGRFTASGQDVPVHYLHRSVPQDELLAYYRLADVCLVTPLADGMNLVAKEFVVAQAAGDGAGALVLSEFAGAIDQLTGALPCNPFDVEGLAGTIDLALELTPEDRHERIQRMARSVHHEDVHRWFERELAALE